MSTQPTLSGTILDLGTRKRISGATIRMETPTKVYSTESNEYGNFTFEVFDESTIPEEQETYEVLLYAYYKEGRQQEPTPLKKKIKKNQITKDVVIEMVNRGPISNRAGISFLVGLILVLLGMIYWYYDLHERDWNRDQGNTDPGIVNILTESLVGRINADSIKVSTFKVNNDSISSADQNDIKAELEEVKEAAQKLFAVSQVDSAFQALVMRNLEDVEQAIDKFDKAEIQAALVSSKAYIMEIPNVKPSWFWRTIPRIYYEVLFWALFATLLRLIGNTSYYVSRNIFFLNSIPHKFALLFTIPLIALLITFVVSFFKIVIYIGQTDFILDFTNPFVSIILASLIGLAPWRAWEFMYGLADLLFNSLKSWMALGKPGDEESEGQEANSNAQNQTRESGSSASTDTNETVPTNEQPEPGETTVDSNPPVESSPSTESPQSDTSNEAEPTDDPDQPVG